MEIYDIVKYSNEPMIVTHTNIGYVYYIGGVYDFLSMIGWQWRLASEKERHKKDRWVR